MLAGVTSKEKGELCQRHGADHVVDLAAPDPRESLRKQVHAAIGEGGVDVVLDSVGGDVFDARYPFERFAEALARFEARQVQGKIVLQP